MDNSPNTPIRLLFASARPYGSDHIRFQEEHERIKRLLPASFEVVSVRTASIRELREAFIECRPQLFHFAGHGTPEGYLLMEDAAGSIEPLAPDVLARLFQTLRSHYTAPYAVFLNACHSLAAAQAIAPHVPLVIGAAANLPDDTALAFATGFYHALPRGTWQGAFEMGGLALPTVDLEAAKLLAWAAPPKAPWVPAVYKRPEGLVSSLAGTVGLDSKAELAGDDYLTGEWHGYYFTHAKEGFILTEEKWLIRGGLQEGLTADVQTLPHKKLSYKGEIYTQRNNLVIRLRALEYDEDTFCIFNFPVPAPDAVLVGLWLGLDFTGRITAGPGILSRQPQTEQSLRDFIEKEVQANDATRTIRVQL